MKQTEVRVPGVLLSSPASESCELRVQRSRWEGTPRDKDFDAGQTAWSWERKLPFKQTLHALEPSGLPSCLWFLTIGFICPIFVPGKSPAGKRSC